MPQLPRPARERSRETAEGQLDGPVPLLPRPRAGHAGRQCPEHQRLAADAHRPARSHPSAGLRRLPPPAQLRALPPAAEGLPREVLQPVRPEKLRAVLHVPRAGHGEGGALGDGHRVPRRRPQSAFRAREPSREGSHLPRVSRGALEQHAEAPARHRSVWRVAAPGRLSADRRWWRMHARMPSADEVQPHETCRTTAAVQMKTMRRATRPYGLAIAFLLAALLSAASERPAIGDPAPMPVMRDLRGGDRSLKELAGRSGLVVVFWAGW